MILAIINSVLGVVALVMVALAYRANRESKRMKRAEHTDELCSTLILIRVYDEARQYELRNPVVYRALALAASLGYPCGVGIDEREPDWLVVYIDLPDAGQVSWHVPKYPNRWDGHTTWEKYVRIDEYRYRSRKPAPLTYLDPPEPTECVNASLCPPGTPHPHPAAMRAPYNGMDPVYPCREIPTRHCPAILNGQCPPGPCARYDVTDEAARVLWEPELLDRERPQGIRLDGESSS